MKKTAVVLILLGTLFQLNIFAQNPGDTYQLSGYVNYTAIYDSRKTIAGREGHFFLFPDKVLPDINGKDLNAVPNFNMAVIQTRLGLKAAGPEFLGASTSGYVEAEFMGNSNADVNGFRIRHAFLNMNWGNTSLLLGQYWNPMFVTEVYPNQSGSNGGAPFQPFARNPQLRLVHKIDNLRFTFALVTERDYTSTGPSGYNNNYLREAILPDLHFQLQANLDKHLFGAGAEYKILRPASKTEAGYYTDNTISSYSFMGYSKFIWDSFSYAFEAVYGSNMTTYTMLGGYAVKSVDPVTKSAEYTAVKTLSLWNDIETKGALSIGLFAGYSKNLGAEDNLAGPIYSRGADVDYLYRIAPRICYTYQKLKFCFEIEHTAAAYGTTGSKGQVENPSETANTRVFTSIYFMF